MAGGEKSDDEFFRNIFGENAYSSRVSDENRIQQEIQRLEKALRNDNYQQGKNPGPTQKSTVHECVRCSKVFRSKWNLSRHMKNVHEKEDMGFVPTVNKSLENNKNSQGRNHGLGLKAHHCVRCSKLYRSRWNLDRHMKNVHGKESMDLSPKQCNECSKYFDSGANLNRHIRNAHGKQNKSSAESVFSCGICSAHFKHKRSLNRHVTNMHTNTCSLCGKKFDSRRLLSEHALRHLNTEYLTLSEVRRLRKQAGGSIVRKTSPAQTRSTSPQAGTSSPANSESDSDSSSEESNQSQQQTQQRHPFLDDSGVRFVIKPEDAEKYDLLGLFSNRRSQLMNNLRTELKRKKGIKFYCCVKARMLKYDADGNVIDQAIPTFRSTTQAVLTTDGLDAFIDAAFFKISASIDAFKATGSSWLLDEVIELEQTVLKYRPLRGECADFMVPEILNRKACILNVVGRPADSTDCFLWSVLAGLHSDPSISGEKHWTEYSQHRDGLRFEQKHRKGDHVSLADIEPFEQANNLSIHVFGWEDQTLFPLYISKQVNFERGRHVNLLLLQSEAVDEAQSEDEAPSEGSPRGHFCVIQDLARLAFKQCAEGNRHQRFFCMRCLNPKSSQRVLKEHQRLCSLTEPLKVMTPEPEKRWYKFRNFQRQLQVPFIIVARFEYFTVPIYDRNEPTVGKTVRERKLEPCAFAYFRMCIDDFHPSEPVVYIGEDPDDVMVRFMQCMDDEESKVFEILSKREPMVWCDRGLQNVEKSNDECYVCGEIFHPNQKVCLDHSHVTGLIRGRCCNKCNLHQREPKFLPIIMNNLMNLDGRIVMKAVAKHGQSAVNVIAKSIDTYVSITVNRCRYLDGQRFLNCPLETMVESLKTEKGSDSFRYTKRFIPEPMSDLFNRKQVFCCDYIDGPECLYEMKLPPKKAFHNRLSNTDITDAQYSDAQLIWNALPEKTLKEYLKACLLFDILQMSDVVTCFRETLMTDLKLDPFQYHTLSSFAWDSAIKYSDVSLELITDLDIHLCVETAIRGGCAVLGSPRYARANNKNLPAGLYDPQKEASTIHFFDFNGLYCHCMCFPLPLYGFRWLSDWELERFDVSAIPANANHGFIIDCDLHYPENLHDDHDGFPLAPEHVKLTPEDLSDYTKNLAHEAGLNIESAVDMRKLCLTLNDKDRYITHYRNLQMYLKHGMQLKRIHRVIQFTQSPFLETFMGFMGDKRRQAKSPFFKSLYKSIPNNVFGKSIENVRNYKDVKICTNATKLKKLVALPTFDTLRIFDDDLAAVQMFKRQVILNRPLSVGFGILEFAKLRTYEFYYEFVLPSFKHGRVAFLAGDTDSFVIKIDGVDDVDTILRKSKHLFDFSNLPESHPLKDDTNKMKPGKLKFELAGNVCIEWCSLASKCYSMLTDSGFRQARKGSKHAVRHEVYKKCLLNDTWHTENVCELHNYGQNLYHTSVSRRLLSPIDLKRYYFNNLESASYGHYKIQALKNFLEPM